MSTINNNDIKKVIQDRKNWLQSDLAQMKTKKLDKVINDKKVNEYKIRMSELIWIEKKLKL